MPKMIIKTPYYRFILWPLWPQLMHWGGTIWPGDSWAYYTGSTGAVVMWRNCGMTCGWNATTVMAWFRWWCVVCYNKVVMHRIKWCEILSECGMLVKIAWPPREMCAVRYLLGGAGQDGSLSTYTHHIHKLSLCYGVQCGMMMCILISMVA